MVPGIAESEDVAWQCGRHSLCLNLLRKDDLSAINLKVPVLPGKLFCSLFKIVILQRAVQYDPESIFSTLTPA